MSYSTNLLEKLVEKEQINTLVLNFYPLDQGYSLGFNIKNCEKNKANHVKDVKPGEHHNNNTNNNNSHLTNVNKIETKLLSYDETELLYYINAGEIPPVLIDLIDRLEVNLYKDGCILMEIRDYRRRLQLTDKWRPFDSQFILLQPSMQTLLADLNSITNDGNFIWTQVLIYGLRDEDFIFL